MNMIYESMRNKGGLVLVPSSALGSMNIGTVLGTGAYEKDLAQRPEVSRQDTPATSHGENDRQTTIQEESSHD